jgi:hypothetical protein
MMKPDMWQAAYAHAHMHKLVHSWVLDARKGDDENGQADLIFEVGCLQLYYAQGLLPGTALGYILWVVQTT